jgi:hypothetical protein
VSNTSTDRPGLLAARRVAWSAFALGVAASVAANVAHARPELGPRLASAFAPVALLLTVELMARIPWPPGPSWALGRWAGTGLVAAVAAWTSYRHMAGLLVGYGEDTVTAYVQPACVDGLMIVASLALLALGHTQPRKLPAIPELGDATPAVAPNHKADRDPVTAASTGVLPPLGVFQPDRPSPAGNGAAAGVVGR